MMDWLAQFWFVISGRDVDPDDTRARGDLRALLDRLDVEVSLDAHYGPPSDERQDR